MTDNRILIISHVGCGRPFAGNKMRMQMLLREIRRLGFEVHFAGVKMSDEEREATLPHIDKWVANFSTVAPDLKTRIVRKLARILTRFGLKKSAEKVTSLLETIDHMFDARWGRQIKELQQAASYKRVLVAYVFHSAFLCYFPSTCLKVLDTHDVFADRRQRLAAAGEANYWFTTTRSEERIGIMRADRILAIQSHEEHYFRQLTDQERPVYTVGHFTEPKFLVYPTAAEPVIGMLSSGNHLNVSGAEWFFKSVWPLVLDRHPKATLRIGGAICAYLRAMPAVELIGNVEDPVDFYAKCFFTINPIQVGTGLKIKTVESLSFGRPAVVSPPGADGLEFCVGKGLMVANDARQFAHMIEQLLCSRDEVERLGRAAVEALEEFNREARDHLSRVLLKTDGFNASALQNHHPDRLA